MLSRRLFNWFFYGHIWIALAATGLSWLSLRIVYGEQSCVAESPILTFIFFATLGVYTLHRYLSFQRAERPPSTSRYNIVARHPEMSLWIGGLSVTIAGYFSLDYITIIWPALLLALPLTIFYLTPPLSGWRRLRDLPYLKNLWVALAWTIMTVVVPVIVLESRASIFRYGQSNDDLSGLINLFSCGDVAPLDYSNLYLELAIRFLFTGCIALLFDLRDVALDRSQEVRTIAGQLPTLHRILVYGGLFTCAVLSLFLLGRSCIVPSFPSALAGAYLLMIPVAYFTYSKTDEAWYAVVVNGLLLLPPFLYFLWGVLDIWGAGAGAGLG